MQKIRNFLSNEQGATAVEYGLMVALIAAVVVAGASFLGDTSSNTLNSVGTDITVP